jgi:hypothetical protein
VSTTRRDAAGVLFQHANAERLNLSSQSPARKCTAAVPVDEIL